MRGSKDERERSDMVDPREETPGLSDHTEFTETQDPSTTQHGGTLGTDPSGTAARREGLKAVFGDTEAQGETKGKPGRDVARRDPIAWGRAIWASVDNATRQWSASAAEPRRPIPEPDVRRLGWRRIWGRRTCTAV
jgi:hypothetical protein